MRRISTFIATAALVSAVSASTAAQTPRPDPAAGAAVKTAAADTAFAQKAAMGGKKEVEGAKFVAAKAASADVRAFANRLVKDHAAANQELAKLMKNKRIAASSEAKAEPEAWRSETGAALDRAFIDHAIADHEQDITLFETEAKDGADAELKDWAAKKLPTLREHLKAAQDLKAKLQTTTR